VNIKTKIKDLIDNIEIGNAEAINGSFSTVMAEKVSARLDSMKKEVASTIFKDEITSIDEGMFKNMAIDLKDVSADDFYNKYKITKADAMRKYGKSKNPAASWLGDKKGDYSSPEVKAKLVKQAKDRVAYAAKHKVYDPHADSEAGKHGISKSEIKAIKQKPDQHLSK